ncbi:MAG: hypothetical protein M0C28_30925 [Candidatus Moduliflexus flocculans]|nr:hypothetical protein [Candidatus Moduliflexus flocculans]
MAREPLVHFLIAGALLFAAYAWLNRGADDLAGSAERTVRITANEVEWLKQTWARQWQRPPSDDELKGLVAGYLKETLLAREARARRGSMRTTRSCAGALRRRWSSWCRTRRNWPSRAKKSCAGCTTRSARFQSSARITFTHVYFNRDRRGARAQADARAALQRLAKAETNATGPGESAGGASVHRGPRLDPIGDRFLAQYDFHGRRRAGGGGRARAGVCASGFRSRCRNVAGADRVGLRPASGADCRGRRPRSRSSLRQPGARC